MPLPLTGGDGMEGDMVSARKDWLVSCRDVGGRRRDIIVFADRGRVVCRRTSLETPLLEVGRLRAALRDALVDAAGHEAAADL